MNSVMSLFIVHAFARKKCGGSRNGSLVLANKKYQQDYLHNDADAMIVVARLASMAVM